MKRNSFIEKTILAAVSIIKESVFSEEIASKIGFLQGLDARFKVLSIFVFVFCALFLRHEQLLLILYVLCLALTVLSGVSLIFFFKRTLLFIPLFSFLIVFPSIFGFFTPGQVIWEGHIGSVVFSITKQGLNGAVLIITRVTVSVSLIILLSLTTRHFELLKTLRTFGIPDIFVMVAGMCYRYIYLFAGIVENTFLAIKSRTGGIIKTGHGQKITAWNIAMLWRRSYILNENVYDAMRSRGFTGEPVSLNASMAKMRDFIWFAFFITAAASFIALDYFIKGWKT